MKHIFTFLFSLFITGFAFAQTPMQTTVEYNGQKYPCYLVEYNLPPDETENVIKNKLKSEGYNAEKSKGFLVYRNVRLKDLNSSEAQDVFFKIERKSRKEKDKSLVTMIAAKSGVIPEDKVKGAKSIANIEPSANSVSFIKSFENGINLQTHNLVVSAQEEEVATAEKKLKSLQDAQVKLEKKIKDYQSDLEKNKKDQENQTGEIAKQKTLLDQKKTETIVE
jgi:cell division protein FtsB